MVKYYEVSISVDKVLTYKVEANNEVEAEELAVKMAWKHDGDFAEILDSSGAITEINEEQFYE